MNEAITQTTIGCDLGDKKSDLCLLQPTGELERLKLKTTAQAFRELFTTLKAAHVVIEVGAHSRWVSSLLTELGHRVTVANARRLRLISQSDSKTDRNDAELLARLGRADVALLAPIKHRKNQEQADLAVAKARDALVATRTRLVNHARGTVKTVGQRLPTCTADVFHRVARAAEPPELKPALDPVFTTLEKLQEQIRECDRELKNVSKRYPDAGVVGAVDGVGLLTAMVFLRTWIAPHTGHTTTAARFSA
jgi:transposase